MMPRVRPRSPLALVLVALVAHGTPARAQSGDTCVTAYEGAQELRQRGALVQARRELDVCRASCPAALARDCEAWQRDVASRLGRVKLLVTRDAARVSPDRVLVDGQPAVVDPEGVVAVDPGDHDVRIDIAGAPAAEHAVSVPPGGEVTLEVALASSDADEGSSWSPSTPALVVGGIGLGALLVGGGLGVAGHVRVGDLRDGCAPDCAASDVDAVRTMWIAGGVAAGVGVSALAVALALTFASRGDAPATETGLVLAPPPPGAPLGVGARGTF